MEASRNTQMPKSANHFSADRRNTPATSFQSAFHHSVTTCQLQSLSLRHTALIFTKCAAAWDIVQPCQKYDTGRITFLHLLGNKHCCILILLDPCRGVRLHSTLNQCIPKAKQPSTHSRHPYVASQKNFGPFTFPVLWFYFSFLARVALIISVHVIKNPCQTTCQQDWQTDVLTDWLSQFGLYSLQIHLTRNTQTLPFKPTDICTPEAKKKKTWGEQTEKGRR